MGSSVKQKAGGRLFVNYPDPQKGPDIPYKNDRKPNPPVRGWRIVPAAFLMERLPFVREKVWHNAGFGSLRKIAKTIEDYEPWFEPTVIPLNHGQQHDGPSQHQAYLPEPVSAANYPAARYYSVEDYHRLYMSGELTPVDVAKALLPLILRDTNPPGEHSTAWFETKVDQVLQAAEASTLRSATLGRFYWIVALF